MRHYKIIFFSFIVYILVCFTTYFSMCEYSKEISSSCFECSYQRDVLLFSLFISIIFSFLFFLLKRILKKKIHVIIIFIISFALLIFYNIYGIFCDRVSSWSSFTLESELINVFYNSYLYITISSILIFAYLRQFRL